MMNTPEDVIRSLIADDGFELREGPYGYDDGQRSVAYVAEHGPYGDVFRVEVKLHSRGEDREAKARDMARRIAAAEESESEYQRVEPLLGKEVLFHGEPAILVHVVRGEQPDDPIEVGCVGTYGAGPHDPQRGVSTDVTTTP